MPGTIPHSHMNSPLVDCPRSGAPILHPLGTLEAGGGHIKRLPPRGVVKFLLLELLSWLAMLSAMHTHRSTPRRAGDLCPGSRIQNRLHDHAMVPLAFPHDMFCADIPERSPHGSLLTLRPSRNPPRRPIRRVLLAQHQAAPPRHLTIPEFRPTAEIAASSAAMLHHAPLFRNEENFSSKNS
jgi:hypothetical protein